jgi:protocatechuate 3,4-dioxygenase, beta subunit
MLANRRLFLQMLSGGMTIALPGWSQSAQGLWVPEDDLPATPSQTEGPFYPDTAIEKQMFNDTDLVQKMAGHEYAKGQPVVVQGIVRDRKGRPQIGAVVEVWQACAAGRYNHSRDNSTKHLLDNNFQFWGRAITGEDGKYSFTTIIPGLYPGRMGRHIHYRIDTKDYKRLTTQCYFSEFAQDNAKDTIYQSLNAKDRDLVTVQLEKSADNKQPWSGSFNIVVG